MRTIMSLAVLVIVLLLTSYLVYLENAHNKIAPTEAKVRHLAEKSDPQFDMLFLSTKREENLTRMGLTGALLKDTLRQAQRNEDELAGKLTRLLNESAEPDKLVADICGRTNDRRPRYGAIAWLVVDEKGERRPIDLARVTKLERQDWAVGSSVDEIYKHLELADGPHPDATLMGVAGILLKQEEKVLQDYKPWGSGLVIGQWSWEDVIKTYPGIAAWSRDYFALMHVTLELANSEEGVCNG